ncbi:MAG: hypothetical protein DCC58_17650 [Chloroflexi bacterium]|nr:MAG: hypothetical protein DCC58_17650 [Chloroflexota bacterium]
MGHVHQDRPPLSPRAIVAFALLTLSVLLMVAAAVLVLIMPHDVAQLEDASGWADIVGASGLAGYALIGALIVWRRPDHRIGWLYLFIGVGIAIYFFTDTWATYTLIARPGSLPFGNQAVWLANWLGVAALYIALTWPLLLFPTGHLPGSRWRWVFGLSAASIAVMTVGFALTPGELSGWEGIENPYAVIPGLRPWIEQTTGIAALIASLCVPVAAIAALVRLRRSRGIERQQLKWFVWSGGVVALSLFIALAITFAWDATWWAGALVVGALLLLVAATGIAILRYQLYDIDIIINRTLVYGTLSVLLGAIYAAGVVVAQQALAAYASGSDLAVAGTTLAVAALVRPGRARVQRIVDRRFYRHKYDAERTIDAFSDRLRDELDLDSLITEIRQVANETMQPAHVSVWLRVRDE